MAYTQILRNRSTSIKPEEEAFKARIETVNQKFEHESQIRARVMEIKTRIEHMRDDRMDASSHGASTANIKGAIAGDVSQLKIVLNDHEKWLASLSAIVRKDSEDVNKMIGDYADILAPSTATSS